LAAAPASRAPPLERPAAGPQTSVAFHPICGSELLITHPQILFFLVGQCHLVAEESEYLFGVNLIFQVFCGGLR
jgi:hypothetical protein